MTLKISTTKAAMLAHSGRPVTLHPDGSISPAEPRLAFPFRYAWDRQGRKGQFCRVLCRGTMNSRLVEFEDGYKMVTSGNSIRRRLP